LLDRGTFHIFVKQPRLGPGERGASLENASYDLPARRALIVSANISSRLAAVWFADIVGYSQLASRDETSALALVEQLRSMIEEILAEHGGRLVKATGDGGLAEFASAEAAVRSGLALERRFAERAGLLVPGARLRVGIHVGEVVPGAGGDLYGDGVNTAARLQQSAEPGQVVVSEDVWRSLRQRSELWFTPLGERRLKGLAAPIRVFQVAPGEPAARRGDRTTAWIRRAIPGRGILYAAAAAIVAILVFGLLAREGETGDEGPAPRTIGAPDPAAATASLAILPFANLSPDPESEYFADGMTEELIGALGRLEGLRVAGRASSFAFKGRNVDAREVGEKLAVGNVLEGSVRKTGERVRVTVQLVDARTGFQLWSETYDRESVDVFTVQEEIALAVGEALDLRLPRGLESFRLGARPPNLEAYELYLRGRHAWRSRSQEGLELAVEHLQRAIARDPNFAEAHAGLADAYIALAVYGYRSREEALPRAREAVERALALEPLLVEALTSRGYLRTAPDSALADFRRAIELNPSYPIAHHWYALMLVSLGRLNEALPQHRRAIELDPLAPTVHGAYATSLLLSGDLDGAEEMARRANELAPELYSPQAVLSRIYAAQGRGAEALQAAERAAALAPENPSTQANLARAHARLGGRRKALEIVAGLEAEAHPCAACIAEVYVALEEYDEALRWLDVRIWNADDEGGWYLPKVDPLYDPLRGDPRFARFLEDVGLE
jgi:adenylate cyclase